jgi:hypothetical protein
MIGKIKIVSTTTGIGCIQAADKSVWVFSTKACKPYLPRVGDSVTFHTRRNPSSGRVEAFEIAPERTH